MPHPTVNALEKLVDISRIAVVNPESKKLAEPEIRKDETKWKKEPRD